jgi:hypothetical protein
MKKILSLSFMLIIHCCVFQAEANESLNNDGPSQFQVSVQTVVTQAVPQHLSLAYKIRQGAGIVAIFDALVNCRHYKDIFSMIPNPNEKVDF